MSRRVYYDSQGNEIDFAEECDRVNTEEVYGTYTDTAGNQHWTGTQSGHHVVADANTSYTQPFDPRWCGNRLPCGYCRLMGSMCPLGGATVVTPTWTPTIITTCGGTGEKK